MKLINKNFLLLVGSQLFSVFGTTISQFAISLYVLDKTGSMGIFSLVLSLSMISRIIFLPFGGIVADRLPKKKLMLTMDFIYLIMVLAMAIGVIKGNTILIMGIISIVIGVVSSFETPVVQSAIPLVCTKEQIPKANGIINSVAMLSNILAPVLAGIIYNFNKAYNIFIVSGVFFLIAIICEIFLTIKQEESKKNTGSPVDIVVEDTKETVLYLKDNLLIVKICLVTFLLNMVISSFITVVLPYTVRVNWLIGDELYGVMNTLFAIGGLGGSIIVSTLLSKINGSNIIKMLLINSFVFLLLVIPYSGIYSNLTSFWLMTILITFLEGIFTMVSVQLISFVQLITDKDIMGRIMSFILMISMLAMPLGQIVYGMLGKFIIGKWAILIIMIISFISILIAIYSRNIFKEVKVVTEKSKI
ncbi:MAG: MFS transporter [Miniphocaeibacter sp.]|uniref:MFS transporter n=1 Tax=Miniphocaeibacter sp. TaxID=3100973 RepID=UPI00181CA736|nr:MFS transporter [Gallicola sp.]